MRTTAHRGVDDDDFADVVRRETAVVFRFLLRRVGDRSLAEDLTQETFLRAWRSRRQFRGDDVHGEGSSMRGWLCTIAANAARDHARRARRRPVEVAEPEFSDLAVSGDLGDHVGHAEALESLRLALLELPARQREMFLLRERDGLSYKEIAATLDCPVGTVMSGLSRARERLVAAVRS